MRLFGFEVSRVEKDFGGGSPPSSRGGWLPIIREPYTGAWQRNEELSAETVLAYHAVFACITLIAADIGKLRIRLVEQDDDEIWNEVTSGAFSPVLKKPNRYQNHIQFKEWWITSKLIRGNAYALLERDNRNVVVAMYLLDPQKVQVLISPDGSVFYELGADNLSGIDGQNLRVPASEIIHDRMNCLFHPLVGVSPMFASGSAAALGLRIQNGSTSFFANNSVPGGVLTAPEHISDDTAGRLKAHWEANYTGANSGRIAVLGDGLKFEPMRMSAVESELIDQLRITAEVVCSTFHVPGFMVGVGAEPAFSNGETRTQHYYSQCLQSHIESMELCLDEALGLNGLIGGRQLGTELDLTGLLRMDSSTQINSLRAAIEGSLMAPNEGRKAINLPPLEGGNTIYMQQQNYSLAALSKRDQDEPFAKPPVAAPAAPPVAQTPAVEAPTGPSEPTAKDLAEALLKKFSLVPHGT